MASSDSSNNSIFEKVASPAQEVPNITPMRRGRPNKTESPTTNSSPVSADNTFDPFDPSHAKNSSTPPKANVSPIASFQNSFTPENTSTVPTRVQSAPLTHHVTPKPQLATKILQTQPSSPMKPEHNVPPPQEEEQVDEVNEHEAKMNRGVSSSIEARFMAIKNAGRNSIPIKPTPTTSTSKKNKPAPPPKPARFRSKATVPSVDDFENKFPSLEELDKSISE